MATADKVLRKDSCVLAKDVPWLKPYSADTVELINTVLDKDEFILIEGTQGLGLSIDHGEFPFVTSQDISTAAIAASIGLGLHNFDVEVMGVTRTYPIRVAGNSGPFGNDSEEITWQELTERAKALRPITERTSVTQKVRRVATFSKKDFLRACQINRPTAIALTFADYLDWSVRDKESFSSGPVESFMEMIEKISGVPITLIKTGPRATTDLDWYRSNIMRKVT